MKTACAQVPKTVDLPSFIAATNAATETLELFHLLTEALTGLDFDCVSFYTISSHFQGVNIRDTQLSYNYPDKYTANKYKELYSAGDPVVTYSLISNGPARWDDLIAGGSNHAKNLQLLEGRRDVGLYSGISIPLRSVNGVSAALELASSFQIRRSDLSVSMASLFATQFFTCIVSLLLEPEKFEIVRLTPMEREVLQLIAKGMTKQRASVELDVSLYAVDFHCRNILKKYKTKKIIVAAVNANLQGQIHV